MKLDLLISRWAVFVIALVGLLVVCNANTNAYGIHLPTDEEGIASVWQNNINPFQQEQLHRLMKKNKSMKGKKGKKKKDKKGIKNKDKKGKKTKKGKKNIGRGSKKIGFALPGGGAQAGAHMSTILRGFQKQKIMIDGEERSALDNVHAISALSGGNTASIMYHYAQDTTSDEVLDVDSTSDPTKITNEELEMPFEEKSLFSRFTVSLLPPFVLGYLNAFFSEKPLYPEIVNLVYLTPLGIPSNVPMTDLSVRSDVKSIPIVETAAVGPASMAPHWYDHKMYMSFFEKYKEEFAELEPIPPEIPLPGFSFSDNEIIYSWAKETGFNIPLPAYGTDTHFHVPITPADGKQGTMLFDEVDGLSADPIDFDGPVAKTYDEVSSESDPFTLAKLLGMGTDVVGIMPEGNAFSVKELLGDVSQRPITVDIPFKSSDEETVTKMAFTDGGACEGNGLPGILTQKPTNVIMPQFAYATRGTPAATTLFHLLYYFGFIEEPVSPYYQYPEDIRATRENVTNQYLGNGYNNYLFERNDENIEKVIMLFDTMDSLEAAGEPLIVTMEGLDVVENPFWGIEGGWKVDLTIIHVRNVPQKFADLLPDDVAAPPPGEEKLNEFGFFSNEDFASGPFAIYEDIDTNVEIPFGNETITFQIPQLLLQTLTSKSLKMSSLINSWMIDRAWDPLIGADGEVKFDGFRSIFEDEEEPKKKTKVLKPKK